MMKMREDKLPSHIQSMGSSRTLHSQFRYVDDAVCPVLTETTGDKELMGDLNWAK